jgi:simple sugar transport system permease protein
VKTPAWKIELTVAAVALLVAAACGSLLMIVAGASPLEVAIEVVDRIARDPYRWGQIIFDATPLVFTGLAVAIARRVGLFNIGGEGQLAAGCLACGTLGAALPAGTPAPIAILLCTAAAAAAGGAIGALTGALRAYRGAHEVIVAILLNAIVGGVALWIGNTWLFHDGLTAGPPIASGAELPRLGLAGSSANASAFVAVLALVATWWLFARAKTGAEWRWVGEGPRAAATAGLDVPRAYVAAMAVSGAVAGLCATNYVLGWRHAYQTDLGQGAGFLGIAVALLGGGEPLGVGLAALFVGFLENAGLAAADQVPKELFDVLDAVIIAAVAATGPWVRARMRRPA